MEANAIEWETEEEATTVGLGSVWMIGHVGVDGEEEGEWSDVKRGTKKREDDTKVKVKKVKDTVEKVKVKDTVE